jgi:non-ribosomal peptide synthetase component F
VPGELYLGGPKVSLGYAGRKDLTAKAYMHMDSVVSGGRMYATGDRVRWLPSGDLEFLGRVDFQIKLNGQRIEAGEIEAVVEKHVAGVKEVLVMLRKSAGGADHLAAYVLPQCTA